MGRWILRLHEHYSLIVYKSGQKHYDADGLSGRPLPDEKQTLTTLPIAACRCIMLLTALSLDCVANSHRADGWSLTIIVHLDGSCPSQRRQFIRRMYHFCLMNAILYRHNSLLMAPRGFLWYRQNYGNKYCRPSMMMGRLVTLVFFKHTSVYKNSFWARNVPHSRKECEVLCQSQRRKRPATTPACRLQPRDPPAF